MCTRKTPEQRLLSRSPPLSSPPDSITITNRCTVSVCVCVYNYSISLTQSEIHYGVLQLLLSLSEQPTATPWEPPHEEDPIHQGSNEKSQNRQRIFADTSCVCVLLEVGDEFDWAAYLREGIEYQTYDDSGSEVCLYTCVAVDNSN